VALESDAAMVATARRLMTELGCGNASVVQGPLAQGYPAGAPYDAIVFGGAIAAVPDAIAGQLVPGGRIVAVMLPERGVGQATVMTRVGSVLSRRPHFDAATPLLPDFAPRPGFEF
jgi:protein-L-isoaspartate(D-aspartate) O-methyltransferase